MILHNAQSTWATSIKNDRLPEGVDGEEEGELPKVVGATITYQIARGHVYYRILMAVAKRFPMLQAEKVMYGDLSVFGRQSGSGQRFFQLQYERQRQSLLVRFPGQHLLEPTRLCCNVFEQNCGGGGDSTRSERRRTVFSCTIGHLMPPSNDVSNSSSTVHLLEKLEQARNQVYHREILSEVLIRKRCFCGYFIHFSPQQLQRELCSEANRAVQPMGFVHVDFIKAQV